MSHKMSRRNFLKVSAGATAALALAKFPVSSAFAQDQVTVRYLVPQWASTRDRRTERQIAFRSAIDSFHLKFPNYRLNEIVGSGDQVGVTQALENDEADAVWVEKSWYTQWQANGNFADLSAYMSPGEEDNFFDFTIEYLRSINGELGALWHNTDTPLFFYDSSKIENPPSTWEELLAWAEEYKANHDHYAFTMPYENWFQLFGGNMERLGGRWVDEMGMPVAYQEHRDIIVRLAQPFIDLIQRDLIPGEAVLNNHNSQMPLLYAGDAVSFFGNSNMHIRALEPNLPPDEYGNWAATTLPYPEELEGQQRAYTAGGWVIALVKNEDRPEVQDAAAQWVLHATGFEAIRDTTKAGGWVPTRPAIITDDYFYSEDQYMQVTLAALEEHGYVPPAAPVITVISNATSEAIQAAASGQLSLDDALDAAAERIDVEYAELTA